MSESNKPVQPVFVFAPSARCGITLLQRLLNSSGQIIIYGENSLLINSLPNNIFAMNTTADQHYKARQKLISGEYDFWSSAIWPDIKEWQAGVIKSIELLLRIYQDSSARDGFSKWGIKNPVEDARFCAFYFQTFPASKVIFIYRHIVDVMMSHKARKWIPTLLECAKITQKWCRNVSYMLNGDVPGRVMVIRYEDMLTNKDEYVERIEKLVGITGIDKGVFNRKINTFTGTKEIGYSPNQYIEPDELNEQEIEIIKKMADDLLKKCNYPSVEERLEEKRSQSSQRQQEALAGVR